MSTIKRIPPHVRGPERRALQALFKAASDGVITKREASAFAAKFSDQFDGKTDRRTLRYAVQEMTDPGTTYANGFTPDARLTPGAREVLSELNGGSMWWAKK